MAWTWSKGLRHTLPDQQQRSATRAQRQQRRGAAGSGRPRSYPACHVERRLMPRQATQHQNRPPALTKFYPWSRPSGGNSNLSGPALAAGPPVGVDDRGVEHSVHFRPGRCGFGDELPCSIGSKRTTQDQAGQVEYRQRQGGIFQFRSPDRRRKRRNAPVAPAIALAFHHLEAALEEQYGHQDQGEKR